MNSSLKNVPQETPLSKDDLPARPKDQESRLILSDEKIERGRALGTDFNKWYTQLDSLVRSVVRKHISNTAMQRDVALQLIFQIGSYLFESAPSSNSSSASCEK